MEFNKLSIEDARNGKQIRLPSTTQMEIPIKTPRANLSVRLEEALPMLFHAGLIEKKALDYINNETAIVSAPTQDSAAHRKQCFLVASGNKMHKVEITGEKVTCDCIGYR